jgi:hypothetical protein
MVTRVEEQNVAHNAQVIAQDGRTKAGHGRCPALEHFSVDLAVRWVMTIKKIIPSNEECPLLRYRADPKPANASRRRVGVLPGGYENRHETTAAGVAFAPEATLLSSLFCCGINCLRVFSMGTLAAFRPAFGS